MPTSFIGWPQCGQYGVGGSSVSSNLDMRTPATIRPIRREGLCAGHARYPSGAPPPVHCRHDAVQGKAQFLKNFKAYVSCSGHGYPILMQDTSNHAECPRGACEQPRFAVPRAIPRSSRSVGRLWRPSDAASSSCTRGRSSSSADRRMAWAVVSGAICFPYRRAQTSAAICRQTTAG